MRKPLTGLYAAALLLVCAACSDGHDTLSPATTPQPAPAAGPVDPTLPPGHPPIEVLPPGHPPMGEPGAKPMPVLESPVTWTLPEGWTEGRSGRPMRVAELTVVPATPHSQALETIVYGGIGGSADENVAEWMRQFTQPDGVPTPDRAVVTKTERDGLKITRLEVSGTYSGAMGGGAAPAEATPSTMLAAVVEAPGGNVMLKLVGSTEMVVAAEEQFDALLASMKPR